MEQLKQFRKANDLTQERLGEYLGIKKSFLSRIESGKEKMPIDKFRKLVNNEQGWDTSMLVENGNIINQKGRTNKVFGGACNTVYESGLEEMLDEKDQQIAELKAQLAEEKARSERYLTMIEKLMDK